MFQPAASAPWHAKPDVPSARPPVLMRQVEAYAGHQLGSQRLIHGQYDWRFSSHDERIRLGCLDTWKAVR